VVVIRVRYFGLFLLAIVGCGPAAETRVGSKADTESVVLGELAAQMVRTSGTTAVHRQAVGGTLVLWEALLAGEIDVYPEFTGTLALQILNDPSLADFDKLQPALAIRGIGIAKPLGYENNYAVGVRRDTAERLNLRTVSDLARHPELRFGFSAEFTRRADGWPGLRTKYGLPQGEPRALEHAIAYKALVDGQIDATDVYTTDAEIARYDLRVLIDDREYFPHYAAAFAYRTEWAIRNPEALASLERLSGSLDEAAVRRMNARAQDREPEAAVAGDFLRDRLGVQSQAVVESDFEKVVGYAGQHLLLVAVSLAAAIVVAIPLGVFAARRPRYGRWVVGFAGLVQTIPSLALLVFLVAVPVIGGLGARPAIIALFLYSLLPILRNTATGLTDIPHSLREAADGIGLTAWQKLRFVEFPLAARSILAGVKTAAVINIGTATLGALIDAGGLGVPIQQGLRANDRGLILLGAVPAAALALIAEVLFDFLERLVVPRGLRLPPPS